jgi:hypothetical protein
MLTIFASYSWEVASNVGFDVAPNNMQDWGEVLIGSGQADSVPADAAPLMTQNNCSMTLQFYAMNYPERSYTKYVVFQLIAIGIFWQS